MSFVGNRPEPDSAQNKASRGILRSLASSLLFAPLNLLNLVAVNGVSVLRPYAPQLVPIAVCLFLIPFAVCLSLFAGWRVWKSLAVGWEVPLYFQYGQRIIPYAYAVVPPIQPSQPYDVSLRMTLPISESNISLGNFMTTLTLTTPSNETLVTVSRPSIVIPPKASWFLRTSSVIHLDVKFLDSFITKTSHISAYVEVGRQDGWKTLGDGRGREVGVLSASLRGREIPQGIRGLAIRFPLLASTLAASIFLIILSSMVASCVLPSVFPMRIDRSSMDEAESEVYPNELKGKQKLKPEPSPPLTGNARTRSGSTTLRRRRSKLSRRRSSSSRLIIPKTEDDEGEAPVALIPPMANETEDAADVSGHAAGPSRTAARLRRRTSRQLDRSDVESNPESGE